MANERMNKLEKEMDMLKSNQTYIIDKLDEITSKLNIPSFENKEANYENKKPTESKIVYESKKTCNYYVDHKITECYLRMDENNFNDFDSVKYSSRIHKIEVCSASTGKIVDVLYDVYVSELRNGRELKVGSSYFAPQDFCKFVISPNGTKKVVQFYKYESSKLVKYDKGKHYKILMTENEYQSFINPNVDFIWCDLADTKTYKDLQIKQFHIVSNKREFNSDGVIFTVNDFKPIVTKNSDDYCTEDENYEFADGTKLNEKKEGWLVKLQPSDIELLYKKYGYDKWLEKVVMPHKNVVEKYDDGRHLEELRSKDHWAEDAEKSDNMYVKLANLIAWFDIDKIARNIVRINSAVDLTSGDKIETVNVTGTDFTSVRNGLYDNIKECIEIFIRWTEDNELDESYNIFEHQVGRIHFMAMYNSVGDEPDEKWISYKLYWTDEECQEGEE